MIFRGLEPVSLEFPGHVASVLFVGGCNFRCPFCHNASLVLAPDSLPRLEAADALQFLEQRAGWVDGLVVTGGEPTLQAGLAEFLRQVKRLGLAVKLDTNGSRPQVLRELLSEGLVDYVAMDVKAPPQKYPVLTGVPDLDCKCVAQSAAVLREGRVAYEFRTTLVPGLLLEQDVESIARWIAPASRYVLQQFRPLHTLDRALEKAVPYPRERLLAMLERVDRGRGWVSMRGA